MVPPPLAKEVSLISTTFPTLLPVRAPALATPSPTRRGGPGIGKSYAIAFIGYNIVAALIDIRTLKINTVAI